jgi:hypothetical protein
VKELLRRLGQRHERLPLRERVAQALAKGSGKGPAALRSRIDLEAAMSSVERLIRASFL